MGHDEIYRALDRVWISSGLSFSDFKILKFFEFEFFEFKKIGSKLIEFSSLQV